MIPHGTRDYSYLAQQLVAGSSYFGLEVTYEQSVDPSLCGFLELVIYATARDSKT
jgi:hypothetical protein